MGPTPCRDGMAVTLDQEEGSQACSRPSLGPPCRRPPLTGGLELARPLSRSRPGDMGGEARAATVLSLSNKIILTKGK